MTTTLEKKSFLVISCFLTVFGLALFIYVVVTLIGTYRGAWYAGVISLMIGLLGIRNYRYDYFSGDSIQLFTLVCVIGIVLCIAGVSVDRNDMKLAQDTVACATTSSHPSYSCQNNSYYFTYQCYGNSNYFDSVIHCVDSSPIYYGASICNCVTSYSSACSRWLYISPCSFIITDLATKLKTSIDLTFICLSLIITLTIVAVRKHRCCNCKYFQEQHQSAFMGENGSVATAHQFYDPETLSVVELNALETLPVAYIEVTRQQDPKYEVIVINNDRSNEYLPVQGENNVQTGS